MGYLPPSAVKPLFNLKNLKGKKVTLAHMPVQLEHLTARFTVGRQYSVQKVEAPFLHILDNQGNQVRLGYEMFDLTYHQEN